MNWWEGPFLGLDTETSGINVWTDRIVTVSLVFCEPARRPVIETRLLDPGIEIPAQASAVHGISTQTSREFGSDPVEVLDFVADRVGFCLRDGIPVVAFNAAFDLSLLTAELERHDLRPLTDRAPLSPILDPHVIDKQYSRRKGSRTLTATCEHYGVVMSATGAHDASTDALAAVRLLPRLAAAYADLRSTTPEHLTVLQQGWRKTQMDGLRSYFNRAGKDHDGCDGSWPIRSDRPAVLAEAVTA